MLEPYNSRWVEEFAALKEIYCRSLGPLILRVEHVGSTAVPGLMAKPILDIDIVISGYEVFPEVVEKLAGLGYSHNGDQGIFEREAFKVADACVPRVSPAREWMAHHLYVCPQHGRELLRHVAFRDALKANAERREEYARLKTGIVARANGDRKLYAQIKEQACREFVERVLRQFERN
jgi:GrpB-like predicted nucleotidyltransferase (UPF0157 family)